MRERVLDAPRVFRTRDFRKSESYFDKQTNLSIRELHVDILFLFNEQYYSTNSNSRNFRWILPYDGKRTRDGKNEESAAKSREQKRRVRTAARAALAEVVEPATQLHARTNTTAYLTHTSRRCMHCAVHADARTIPLLFSPFANYFVPPPFSPSLSFTLLHPIHPSFSRPSSFLYPTLVSLIPSYSTFSPSSSLHFLSLAGPHLPPFLLLLRLSILSSRSFSPFSMPPSSTNTMLLSLSWVYRSSSD